MFKLHGYIYLEDGKTKATLYLLVHPEMIQSIEFARSHRPPAMQGPSGDDFLSLDFTMIRPPSLVAPKVKIGSHNPKPRYQALFDSMKSLASLCQFTVYLNRLNLIPEHRDQLALLPSVFSPSHPFGLMRTDERLASFDALFRGAPGQVIDLGKTAPPGINHNQALWEMATETAAELTDVIPPPYPNGGSSRNAPGSSTPNNRKRRISESLSLTTDSFQSAGEPRLSLIRTIENEESDERVQPNQFSTPTNRKRPRTSDVIRRLLDRIDSLNARVEQVEELIDQCLNAEKTCRYDTEEVEEILGHMNAEIDERVREHMHDIRPEFEGALLSRTEDWVGETVDLAQDELRREIEDVWVADIRQDITAKMQKMVTREVLKDMAQAVKLLQRAQTSKEDVKSTTTTMSNTTASTLSTATSTKSVPPAPATSLLPGATDLQTAIKDIQTRYSSKVSTEEMMRVLDFLGGNLIEAAKYNVCGAELKWLYVQRWAAKQE